MLTRSCSRVAVVAGLAAMVWLSASPVAAQKVKLTRLEGAVTVRMAVRDDVGKLIGTEQPVVPDKVNLHIDGKGSTLKVGKYGTDLAPGTHHFFAEMTRKVKPRLSREIQERYWAMGAVRIDPNGPATMVRDLELIPVDDSQAYCRTCHPDVRVRLFDVQSCHHSTGKPLKEFYKKPFAKSGLSLEGDLVVCATCHATHLPTGNRKFLLRTMENNELCVQCHV